MLVLIFILTFSIFCFVLFFILKAKRDEDAEICLLPGSLFLIVGLIASIYAIGINGSKIAQQTKTETELKITQLSNERTNLLESYSATQEQVERYNNKADALYIELREKQENANDLWFGWFTCRAYKDVDLSRIQNITFTITTNRI